MTGKTLQGWWPSEEETTLSKLSNSVCICREHDICGME